MVESHIKAILSNVLNIIRAIHLFWNPNFRSQFASSIPKEVFAIDDNIKAPLLGTNYSKKGNDKVPFLRNWLQCVRDDR